MTETQKRLAWGILGTGKIARTFATGLTSSTTGRLEAVGSRTQAGAEAFAAEFGPARAYGSYDAVLTDPSVDVIYISLPNHLHAQWTIRCAEAGKHILCEKPLAVNAAEAAEAIAAVRAHGVFMMEAFMYRCHPQTERLVQLVRSGVIGDVRAIDVRFCYNMHGPQDNIRQQHGAAGGGVMDIGCYCMSLARLIAGAALGQDVAEPIQTGRGDGAGLAVKAFGHIGTDSHVDEWAVASVLFPGEVVATLMCGIQIHPERSARVWGSAGSITVPNPWFPGDSRHGGDEGARLIIEREGEGPRTEVVADGRPLYTIEADTVAAHIAQRQAPSPCMTWADSLGNMRALDAWRAEMGLVFDSERLATR